MNLPTLTKLSTHANGSAGRQRANKWLWSLEQRQWVDGQLRARGITSSNLLRALGVLVPNEAGKLSQAEDKTQLQWAYSYIGRVKDVPAPYRTAIRPAQLVKPADFFAAFLLEPVPRAEALRHIAPDDMGEPLPRSARAEAPKGGRK